MIPGRNGRPVALSTIWRWTLSGRRGHRLQSVRVGGARYTTASWFEAFVVATNANTECQTSTSIAQAGIARQQEVERQLDIEGI
jgi:Protein of unknown function (DUF1580)